jgi:hypothetical protein
MTQEEELLEAKFHELTVELHEMYDTERRYEEVWDARKEISRQLSKIRAGKK